MQIHAMLKETMPNATTDERNACMKAALASQHAANKLGGRFELLGLPDGVSATGLEALLESGYKASAVIESVERAVKVWGMHGCL